MQTTLKHEKNEVLVYVGLGASKAILLYPFWLLKSKGTKSTTAFGGFKTPRGWGWHLGLFGFQIFDHRTVNKVTKSSAAVASIGSEVVPSDPPSAVERPPHTD